MFDLTWVRAKVVSGKLAWQETQGLALACECEWERDKDRLLEDFYKLTFAVADLRLFIYENHPFGMESPEEPALLLKRVCPLSRGFRYMAVGFPRMAERDRGLKVDVWTA